MKKFSYKTLATASLILTCFILNSSYAGWDWIKMGSNIKPINKVNLESEIIDPDLKLSIEELRKKYPIGWMNEKFGNYFDNGCEGGDDSEENSKHVVVCQFFLNEKTMMDYVKMNDNSNGYKYLTLKQIKKVFSAKLLNAFDLTEAQIKSIILNKNIYAEPRSQDLLKILLNQISDKNFHHLLKSKISNFIYYGAVRSYLTMDCANISTFDSTNEFYEFTAINFLEQSEITSLSHLDKKIKTCSLNKEASKVRDIFLKNHPKLINTK